MEKINTSKEYNDYVDKKSPNSPILKDCFNAFWVGGLICSIGQLILDFCLYKGMDNTIASTVVSISLIAISAIITALNVFNRRANRRKRRVSSPASSPINPTPSARRTSCWPPRPRRAGALPLPRPKDMLWELVAKCLLLQDQYLYLVFLLL